MKFCPNCGTGCADETKFCQSCGASLAAQAAPAQPYPPQQPAPAPPQPYPQQSYPMQPPAPAAPPQKKKHTGLKVLLILLLVIALLVGGVIVAAVASTASAANADYYKVGGDQVPSVKLALGEKRKVTSTGASAGGSASSIYRVYESGTPGEDCFKYVSYLVEKDSFVCLEDVDFEDPAGESYFGRNAADDGYKLLATVEWNATGYTVTIERFQGSVDLTEPEPSTQMHTRPEETAMRPEETTTQLRQTQAAYSESEQYVLELATQTLELIKNQDWGALGSMVHPKQGLTFSPYGYVEDDAVCLGVGDVKAADYLEETRVWGYFDGSGEPIEMTFAQYYDRFIFDQNFTKAPQVAVDKIIRSTMQNNLYVFGNGCSWVEFHIPGKAPYPDHTWASLRLVFSWYEEDLYLVAIVHDQWTV